MISDEAVEAAANAIIDRAYGQELPEAPDDLARAALEAAAAHMVAAVVSDLDKWAGRNKPGYYDEAQDDVVQILNPYRSQA